MKNTILFIVSILTFSMAGLMDAVTYADSWISGTGKWDSSYTMLSWTVEDVGELDGYILLQDDYSLTVPAKGISHMIIEVSPNAVTSDFTILSGDLSGRVDIYGPSLQGKSNPNMPENMTGIKFEGYSLNEMMSFTTTRAPVWGDFYSKSGVTGKGRKRNKASVSAWTSGFTGYDTDPLDAPDNGSLDYHILRPDAVSYPYPSTIVPEPVSSTLFLVGGAALGFRRFRRAA